MSSTAASKAHARRRSAMRLGVFGVLIAAAVGASLALSLGSAVAAADRPASQPVSEAGRMDLAQAPMGLQAAVGRTFAARRPALSSPSATFVDPNATDDDYYGSSVALSGDTAVVDAYGTGANTIPYTYVGRVYVYTQSHDQWSLQATLTPAKGGYNGFGSTVAISGGTILIEGGAGVYVYTRDGTEWTQTGTIAAPVSGGQALAISGSTVIVGVPAYQGGYDADGGEALVYANVDGDWTLQATLAPDTQLGENFGTSVAISGSTLVVGAPAWSDDGGCTQGAAFVYTQSGDTWVPSQTLQNPSSGDCYEDYFAASVAISGGAILVGSTDYPQAVGEGAAYFYTDFGGRWKLQTTVIDPNGHSGDHFGSSVAVSGDTAVVGDESLPEGKDEGTAYLYSLFDGQWTLRLQLDDPNSTNDDSFSASIADSGTALVIGAPGYPGRVDGEVDSQGAAYMYNLPLVSPVNGLLNEVSCSTASICMAVGEYVSGATGNPLGLSEHRNGSRWSLVRVPSPRGAGTVWLLGVSCTTSRDCVAVGYSAVSGTVGYPQTLAEHWNGSHWSVMRTVDPGGSKRGNDLYGVSCTSATACTAVGAYYQGDDRVPIVERWNGRSWKFQPSPDRNANSWLASVSCTGKKACTAVGNAGDHAVFFEQWNGRAWRARSTPSLVATQSVEVTGVSCIRISACMVVAVLTTPWDTGDPNTISFSEYWNGHSWKVQGNFSVQENSFTPPIGPDGVTCITATRCVEVGAWETKSEVEVPYAEEWTARQGWKLQSVQLSPGGGNPDVTFEAVSCSKNSCTAVGYGYNSTDLPVTLADRLDGNTWKPNPAVLGTY